MTFRQELLPILKARFRNDYEKDSLNRHLKEASTHAGQTLIAYIRQWKFGSRNIALGRLLECDRWNDKGQLVLERDFKGKDYPFELPLEEAWERYCYGDQQQQYFPNSLASRIKAIPENVTEDWAEEIKDLFNDMGKMPFAAVKIIALGKNAKTYGVGNPHGFANWDRMLSEWKETIEEIDKFVVTRKGWEHLTSENLQNPKHREGMSKVLSDILAEADAIVEPSFKAIREQSRRDRIREHATHARNEIKELKGFFQKYGTPVPNALELVGKIINDVESQTLNTQNQKAA